MIEIDRVTKVYPKGREFVQALSSISLSIREHEFVSILGPSGCGKSTLIQMVSGLVPTSQGTVHIGGERVSGPYKNLGIVFQRDALLSWRTALGNVLLQCEIRHLPITDRLPSRSCGGLALAVSSTASPTSCLVGCGNGLRCAVR
jgi:NitT/TauT family transport system ATP-binding protein